MAHLSIPLLIDCYTISEFSQLKNNATYTEHICYALAQPFHKIDFTNIALEAELLGQ